MATQENLIFHFFYPFSIVTFLLFLFIIYKWLSTTSIPNKSKPPSPPRLPIIGNLHQLGVYPHRSLKLLSQKHGDLMLLHLGSRPTLIVSSAQGASQILKTHDLIFASRPQLIVFKKLLVNGKEILSSPYGEYWRQMKSICVQQLLSSQRIRSFRNVWEEEVALMVSNIKGVTVPVNLSEMFVGLTCDVICRVAFGKSYRKEEGGSTDIKKLVDELTELLGCYCIGDFISWLGWIDRINGTDAKIRKFSRKFDTLLESILQDHLDRRNKDDDDKSEDFVDVLLKAQREGGDANSFLDNESIKGLILDMFVGGIDSSYITLEWIMSELLRNTRVMEKLKQEVRGITSGKVMATEEELEKMVYLKAVIKETLRLHPAGPLMAPHESTKDVNINGYDIAAGTQVMVNVWSISRDLAYWDEPENFFPERFLDSPIDFKGKNFEFIPFGSGRRSCPGMTFAMNTTELVIANLLHHFDWVLPNGVEGESLDMKEAPGLAIYRKYPLLAIPIPRFGGDVKNLCN